MADVAGRSNRYPLTENTNRVNAGAHGYGPDSHKPRSEAVNGRASTPAAARRYHAATATSSPARTTVSTPNAADSRATSELKPPSEADDSWRHSQASYASSSSRSSKYKSHIGPWQLGRTLGKGSSARVRLCRHTMTDQLAAVKIVNRRMAYLVQDSSLAALSKWDKSLPEQPSGEMRVPMAIEREVAILKLIEHPHIMKLYDIWENRSEIYLVLEYIDQGDLFTYINAQGRLAEDVALFFFRQIISAITYCHSFNICHRDLKPENILITADSQIKIADFGMAALHQTDTHQLATACGSPHYAAPELLKNKQYRGDKADIWSMGVILYAMLSATLPFDDPDLRVMMGKTKKGQYEMPQGLSPEAEDLIRRMLQTNPDRRITLKEIWRHPLVQKYKYMDDLGDNSGQPPDTRKGFQYAPVPRSSLDPQLIRQLRSMWHMFSEHDLALKLTCEEPNDQKAFYWLLYNYRNKQLEDFKPELAHSMSDYHHLKPGVWKKRVSTCEFSKAGGHGRSVSRFTVISNAAETEVGTIKSYDPYRGSRVFHSSQSQASQAKVTVHRETPLQGSSSTQTTRMRSGSNARHKRINSTRGSIAGRHVSSRGSMTSLQSSRQGTPQARGPGMRHKRGVDFSHVRKRSCSVNRAQKASNRMASVADVDVSPAPRSRTASPDLPTLTNGATHPKAKGAPTPVAQDASLIFNEELRKFSNKIAKDLDEAFGGSLIEADSVGGSLTDSDRRTRDTSPLSLTFDSATVLTTPASEYSVKPWDVRPLPPLSKERALSSHPVIASPVTGTTTNSDANAPQAQAQASTLQLPQHDRRIVSAPVYPHGSSAKPTSLPSINENGGTPPVTQDKARIVSAPPHTPPKRRAERLQSAEYLSKVENSIRVVHSPTAAYSPVKVPAPLNVRKKSGVEDFGHSLHRQSAYHAESDEPAHDASSQGSQDVTRQKKKMSWFKRSSKVETENRHSSQSTQPPPTITTVDCDEDADQDLDLTLDNNKKKSFAFSFWKNGKNKEPKMSIEEEPEQEPEPTRLSQAQPNVLRKEAPANWRDSRSSSSNRHIEVKQNWLTRLFKVKPATSHVCMMMSRKRARAEVAILLREWRKYGIRGVTIDKQRNIVFARVAAKNYLNLKEVEFAAEIMAVIEHGKKQPLAIVRFTQERGAASSFHRVVETVKTVFESRNLLVTDKSRRKMMIKTLNSHE